MKKQGSKNPFLVVPVPEKLKKQYKLICFQEDLTMEEDINTYMQQRVKRAQQKAAWIPLTKSPARESPSHARESTAEHS